MVADPITVRNAATYQSRAGRYRLIGSAMAEVHSVTGFQAWEGSPIENYVSRVREALSRHDIEARVSPSQRIIVSVEADDASDWSRYKVAECIHEALGAEILSDRVDVIMNGISLSDEFIDIACAPKIKYSV